MTWLAEQLQILIFFVAESYIAKVMQLNVPSATASLAHLAAFKLDAIFEIAPSRRLHVNVVAGDPRNTFIFEEIDKLSMPVALHILDKSAALH